MADKTSELVDFTSLTVVEAVEVARLLEEKSGILAAAPVAHPGGSAISTSHHTTAGNPLRRPVTDFRREAEDIGVPLAPQSDRSEAAAIVIKIAASSSDLFPDESAKKLFLFDHPIDGSGKTAVDLVQERGAAALLIKLDQMRFGTSG